MRTSKHYKKAGKYNITYVHTTSVDESKGNRYSIQGIIIDVQKRNSHVGSGGTGGGG